MWPNKMDPQKNDLNFITNGLARLETGNGLSFAGKQLKLENETDAKPVVDSIAEYINLQYLNLEGNSLGVNAAKAIAKALSKHPEFKRAIWKDMFTGRMKDEIPDALRFLGSGLTAANASLVELDLSDNAFGPIGMEGLVSLLRSSCCYALQELKLNNNGLGITGAKLLSKTLLALYDQTKERGKPLGLRVFIAGRNRLENEGAIALAEVFKKMGTLEELIIPQNGIYFKGITQLCVALRCNKNLKVLNLNDNTVGPKGCIALAVMLPELKNLVSLNLGDCLIKTKGAMFIAKALAESESKLQELVVDYNEMNKDGGIALAAALQNKSTLTTLQMDGNMFGEEGRERVKAELKKSGQLKALVSLDEDNDDSDDEDGDDDDEEEEEEEEDEEEEEEEESKEGAKTSVVPNDSKTVPPPSPSNKPSMMATLLKNITAADFLQFPTPERFLALGPNQAEVLLNELKVHSEDSYLEDLVSAIMKVSSLTSSNLNEIKTAALTCSDEMYKELFNWTVRTNTAMSIVSNCILVHLGLIKCENKSWKIPYKLYQCKEALRIVMTKYYFPAECCDTMNFFLSMEPEQSETITIS